VQPLDHRPAGGRLMDIWWPRAPLGRLFGFVSLWGQIARRGARSAREVLTQITRRFLRQLYCSSAKQSCRRRLPAYHVANLENPSKSAGRFQPRIGTTACCAGRDEIGANVVLASKASWFLLGRRCTPDTQSPIHTIRVTIAVD
jgi:hypothetical protein